MTPLPCPFCASTLIETQEADESFRRGVAICLECGVIGPEVRKTDRGVEIPTWREDAIQKWNMRYEI